MNLKHIDEQGELEKAFSGVEDTVPGVKMLDVILTEENMTPELVELTGLHFGKPYHAEMFLYSPPLQLHPQEILHIKFPNIFNKCPHIHYEGILDKAKVHFVKYNKDFVDGNGMKISGGPFVKTSGISAVHLKPGIILPNEFSSLEQYCPDIAITHNKSPELQSPLYTHIGAWFEELKPVEDENKFYQKIYYAILQQHKNES